MILLILSGAGLVFSFIYAVRVNDPGAIFAGTMSALLLFAVSALLAAAGINQTVTTETVNIVPLNGNYVTLSDGNYFVQTDTSIVSIPVAEAKILKGSPRLEYKTWEGEGTWTVFDAGTETTIYTNTGVAVPAGS